MIISVDAKEAFEKIQYLFAKKLGTEENFLNMMKENYKSPTVNMLIGERPKYFPLSLEHNEHFHLTSRFHFLSQCNNSRKEMEGIWIRKKEAKLPLTTDPMHLHVKNSKESGQ